MAITTMEFEQNKVERIGQGWRVMSAHYANGHRKKYSSEEIASLVEYWSNAKISVFEQGTNWQSSTFAVKLWFAGQALPIEYQFMQLDDQTLVKIDKQTYQLISPSYQMLTLPE